MTSTTNEPTGNDPAPRLGRADIAKRAARDLIDGTTVNLGIGIPAMCADFLPNGVELLYHAENGILGFKDLSKPGEGDANIMDAGGKFPKLVPGMAFFDSVESFNLIRGGHIDVTVLGALQVSRTGDLANWTTNDPKFPPGVGGAMDLAVGAKRIWVLTEHCTRQGEPKLVKACTYPLTAAGVVKRVYTDLAVLELGDDGVVVLEMVPGLTLETLQAVTGPELRLADDWRELVAPEVG